MFVRLARTLLDKQIATFKFDLSGTGDSSGKHEDATWEQWLEDVKTAAESLLEASGTQNLVILGARAGALLAAQASLELKAKRLILAEPIVSGEDFLRDLERRQAIKDMAAGVAALEGDGPLLGDDVLQSLPGGLDFHSADHSRYLASELGGDRHLLTETPPVVVMT